MPRFNLEGQKSEQKTKAEKFVGFHDHFRLSTLT